MTVQPLTAERRDLVEKNIGAAFFHSLRLRKRSRRFDRLDRETIDSAALEGLVESAASWDPTRSTLANWVEFGVRKSLQKALSYTAPVTLPRAWCEQIRRSSTLRTGVIVQSALRSKASPSPRRQVAEDTGSDLEFDELLRRCLTPGWVEIMTWLYRDGWDQNEVAARLGVRRQRVSAIHLQSLEKIRLYMERIRNESCKGASAFGVS